LLFKSDSIQVSNIFGFTLACFFLLFVHCHAQVDPTASTPGLTEEVLLFQQIPSVFSASKYEQKSTEAPSSVTIVTASEIRMYGYRTLADILQSVPGFYISHDRNYSYAGVRGFGRPGDYNSRILLLLDGHRINDHIYNMAPLGTEFPVDVDLIDKVEIVHGPGSSLYGANAFFAVVNVITKRGRDLKTVETSAEVGSFGSSKGRVTYGNRFNSGWESLFSASYFESEGQDLYFKEFDHPSTNRGVFKDGDDDQSAGFFTKHSFQDLTFQGLYQSREKGIPTAAFETVFNDPRSRTTDEYALFDVKYEHLFENQLGLMVRGFFDHYYYNGAYAYDQTDQSKSLATLINKDYATGQGAGTEVQLTKTLFEKHKLIVGAEYNNSIRQDQSNIDVRPFFKYLDDERQAFNWGVYAQDEFKISSKLILNAGARHDWYETFGSSTNPRIALIFLPVEKTALKLIYGEAFRPPNAYELYYRDGGTQKAALDLKPEKIRTYELLWEQYLGNHLRLSASGFYYTVDDLISLKVDPSDQLNVFDNIEEVASKGIELQLDGKWGNGIEGRISYTFENAEGASNEERLTNSPEHLAKLNAIFPLKRDKLFAGFELRYLSPRKTLSRNETEDAVVANLSLFAHDLWKGLDVSAGVYNLLDSDYGDPGSLDHQSPDHVLDVIKQDGISFRLKVTYSF
jgi:iron complex outermembrane receptor protein